MSDRLIIHYEDSAFNFATVGNLFIGMTTGNVTAAHVDVMRSILMEMRRHHPRIAALSVVRMKTAEMRSDVRDGLNQLVRDLDGVSSCSAVVLEGDGLVKGAMRAAAAALMILSRAKFPQKTFGEMAAGLEWTLPYLEPALGPIEQRAVKRDIMEYYRRRSMEALAS